ncbi:MAG: homogentisate 1,2-dioxygenase, partial [Bacteroidia bacterium]
MPTYQKQGEIPPKRHTVFRKANGELFAEELVSTEGFSSIYSLIYHAYPPTLVKAIAEPFSVEPKIALAKNMRHRSYLTFGNFESDYIKSRKILLMNSDVQLGTQAPSANMSYFFKNGDADEILFVHEGKGTLHSIYGELKFGYGDYIVIPRGTIYKMEFETEQNRHFVIEAPTPVNTPKRYRNEHGQLLEHSPFCERDIRTPQNLKMHDEKGDFVVMIKKQGMIYP